MQIPNPRQTFSRPTIPFTGTILGGLLPGEMVVVQGAVLPNADRFQIDFTCGSSMTPRADVAFHFNPRFKVIPCLVCNTLRGGVWGSEEVLLRRMPFAAGAEFEIIFAVQKDKFKVAVNGAHVLDYRHRVELQLVDTLSITGKVKVTTVGVVPSTGPVPPAAGLTNQDADLNNLPFRGQLAEGLSPGRSVVIKGRTPQNADRFGVNLRHSGSSLIAFHLNPRLKDRTLVRNSFLSDRWGPEETALQTPFPFAEGKYFEIIILCEAQQFKVSVNGSHQLEFRRRDLHRSLIDQLEVVGDVQLEEVKVL